MGVSQLPDTSWLHTYMAPTDYVDVYAADLSARADLQACDIRQLGGHFADVDMAWVKALLAIRDGLVAPLGLKTTKFLETQGQILPADEKAVGDRIAFFKIYHIDTDEIVLGEDDAHQDFRLSIYREGGPSPRLHMATCCKRHNVLGHAYLALILPFHKSIVKATLAKGLRKPLAT